LGGGTAFVMRGATAIVIARGPVTAGSGTLLVPLLLGSVSVVPLAELAARYAVVLATPPMRVGGHPNRRHRRQRCHGQTCERDPTPARAWCVAAW